MLDIIFIRCDRAVFSRWILYVRACDDCDRKASYECSNVLLLVFASCSAGILLYALLKEEVSNHDSDGWFQIGFYLLESSHYEPIAAFDPVFNREKTFWIHCCGRIIPCRRSRKMVEVAPRRKAPRSSSFSGYAPGVEKRLAC